MATTSNQSEGGNTNIQCVRVDYDYVEANQNQTPQQPQTALPPAYNDQCCGCFDIRSGIIILGIWLLIESILTLVVWVTIANSYYQGPHYGYYIGFLVFDILFNICGAVLGIYGGYKYSKRGIYAFYLWGIIRCIMAAMDALFAWIYLIILGLWIYWTIVIKRYYRILCYQQLNQNGSGYTRYDANNPYAATNEGVGV